MAYKAPVKWGSPPSFANKVANNINQWGGGKNESSTYFGIATPATPVPPAPPVPAPPDPRYQAQFDTTVAGLKTGRDNTWLGIKGDETVAGNRYGFKINYNPIDLNGDGVMDTERSSLARDANGMPILDPSDPFSKMKLLQRSFEQSKAGDMNSYAAMGQYNAGAYQRQMRETKHVMDRDSDSLYKAFEDILNEGNRGRTNAMTDYTTGYNSASSALLQALLGG